MIQVYRITACNYINDLSGQGSFLYGGRWNSAGTRLLYTAENPSLAMLEALAHVTMLKQSRPYCLATIEIPDDIEVLDELQLLPDWNAPMAPDWMKNYGNEFVTKGSHLALRVPSVLLPGQYNYLINPMHRHSKQLRLVGHRQISFDQRLVNRQ